MKNTPKVIALVLLIASSAIAADDDAHSPPPGTPLLHKRVSIPTPFLGKAEHGPFGGDLRIGDLDGDGKVDFLVYRAVGDFHDGGGMKPCFLGAFDIEGKPLWKQGEGGLQPGRPGAVAIHDLDGDGKAEVICLFQEPDVKPKKASMRDAVVQIRDGMTGEVRKQTAPAALRRCGGKGPNWAHQRILIADFTGREIPQDFVIKLGENVLAFGPDLEVLWTYRCKWNEYGRCPAYTPSVGDIDGDGRDEVNGGYFLLDDDGTVLWEKQLGRHMDSVTIAPWDDGRMRAFCSGFGHVMDEKGNAVLELGEKTVPHGQELRVARFDGSVPGPQMLIRYNAHTPDVMLVGTDGQIIRRFQLNPTPNNTGMEPVFWNGPNRPALLVNGDTLWTGQGRPHAVFPELPPPVGSHRQGWYHCIPANVCGDDREEVILYNPWAADLFIYTPAPFDAGAYKRYEPTMRQVNARLMD